MSTHKAKCDKCSYKADFFDPLRSYEMADGSTVAIERTFVWCSACRTLRWGEHLPDLAQLERDLSAIIARDPAVIEELSFLLHRHQTLEGLLATRKKQLESRIAWRRIRKSPPRCLECSSIDVTPLLLTQTDEGMGKWTLPEHPGCGGMIIAVKKMTLTLDRRWFRYSPEGERRLPEVHTPEGFREQLFSRKHTIHQLRMKLQQMPTARRAEALLGVFSDQSRPQSAFGDQEIAGQLLVALRPKCAQPLDEILRSTASTWNVSVEQLPFYLRDVFGREKLVEAATRLASEYPAESREVRALSTVKWWITGES